MGNSTEKAPPILYEHYVHVACAKQGCDRRRLAGGRYCYLHADVRVDEDLDSFTQRARPAKAKRPSEWTYFVMAPDVGMVKIGRTQNLWARFGSLQGSSPVRLIMWTACKHDESLEPKLHQALDEYRSNGEWFLPSDEVLRVVEIAERCGAKGLVKYLSVRGY